MKLLVLSLEAPSAELLLDDEAHVNLRRLMELGCYGQVETFGAASQAQRWSALLTGRLPGEADVEEATRARTASAATAIWNELGQAGKRSVVLGAPVDYSEYPINGLLIAATGGGVREPVAQVWPAAVREEIARLFNDASSEQLQRDGERGPLPAAAQRVGRHWFALARYLVQTQDWDYFHFVDQGLLLLEPRPGDFEAPPDGSDPLHDYLRYVDAELGSLFELLDDDTAVLIVSTGGVSPNGRPIERRGSFVLAAPTSLPQGEVAGVHLLDFAPTLLQFAGLSAPVEMAGRSLVADLSTSDLDNGWSPVDEEIVRERLRGLGYIE